MYIWTHKKFDIGYNGKHIVDVNLTSESKVKLQPNIQLKFTYEVLAIVAEVLRCTYEVLAIVAEVLRCNRCGSCSLVAVKLNVSLLLSQLN